MEFKENLWNDKGNKIKKVEIRINKEMEFLSNQRIQQRKIIDLSMEFTKITKPKSR